MAAYFHRIVFVGFVLLACPLVGTVRVHSQSGTLQDVGKPNPSSSIKLTFALKQNDPNFLRHQLALVSDLNSPSYGNYINFDGISKHVFGRPEAVKALVDFFGDFGISLQSQHFTIGMDFAVVHVPVHAAEAMFAADFNMYKDSKSGDVYVKSLDYSIPKPLEVHLDFLFGISEFPRPSTVFPRHACGLRAPGGGDVTPDLLYKDYAIGNYTSKSPNNSQAIASFLKQYFSPIDLSDFQQSYNLTNQTVSKIVGTNDPNNAGVEASLDVQFIMTTGRGTSTWFVSTSEVANHNQEGFLNWIVSQVNTTDSPLVHSVSYGDFENSIPDDFRIRMDLELQKFGVSGRTVFFASGDLGVDCKGVFNRHFTPMWPASSPYVTTVGGAVSLTEAWKEGGGGFSNVYPRPSYQNAAVSKYLSSGVAPQLSYFNSSGRAYPDLSAYSVSCLIFILEIPWPVDGTSCATPIYAGVVSLLNDIRLSQGKPPLGFLNPMLYLQLKGKGFFDITKGENSGGGLNLCGGFKATEGWDPASGWGSPNFSVLKDLV